ncbi:hypothetical protein QBC37DRAFT_449800 [Rhypophila decipiens]|uniref:Heterokaryon incompatibility domain-containing protein n=1 Tax=Rhypophila decipiens TaxID=261697 RepID=A0AAN6Y1N9_9PEZI|nr:hypothetical protein QBC37DRAFT_449800 [Rhypophila decipiens]
MHQRTRHRSGATSLAKTVGLKYVWIDTCCIDKTSSAELSEAINSMFSWYRNSAICFIHLAALTDEQPVRNPDIDDLAKYRWFYRAWTIQELVAPAKATFVDREWQFMGTKKTLIDRLRDITGIDIAVLQDVNKLPSIPVTRRLSWAARRKATRQEDLAYCLLGLFDVHMPLIYGEGNKAFVRLQEAIAQSTNDLSIFARQQVPSTSLLPINTYRGIFASSPSEFQHCNEIFVPHERSHQDVSFTLTNTGLRFDSAMFMAVDLDDTASSTSPDLLMGLNCFEKSVRTSNAFKWVAIRLRRISGEHYVRVLASEPVYTNSRISRQNYTHRETVYVIPSLSGRDAAVMHTNTTVGIFYHKALGAISNQIPHTSRAPESSRRTPFDSILIADKFGSYGLQSCVHLHFLTINPTGLSVQRIALVCGLCIKDDSTSPSLVPWDLLCSKDRFPPDHPISKLGVFSLDNSGNEPSASHQDQTELFRDHVYETCSDKSGRPSPLARDLSSEYTYIIRLSYQRVADSEPPPSARDGNR